ncbi:hypothetical protein LTR53_000764 [Teratosphaeriaceae sp. CCFEE 6253]|nr:hypothetical protein LTR53_000764 [Teratosphaeriaceae sp. CCFEE 6253]
MASLKVLRSIYRVHDQRSTCSASHFRLRQGDPLRSETTKGRNMPFGATAQPKLLPSHHRPQPEKAGKDGCGCNDQRDGHPRYPARPHELRRYAYVKRVDLHYCAIDERVTELWKSRPRIHLDDLDYRATESIHGQLEEMHAMTESLDAAGPRWDDDCT